MDLLNGLLGTDGCNVDGTVSRNPLTSFVDQAFNNQFVGESTGQSNFEEVHYVNAEMNMNNQVSMSNFQDQQFPGIAQIPQYNPAMNQHMAMPPMPMYGMPMMAPGFPMMTYGGFAHPMDVYEEQNYMEEERMIELNETDHVEDTLDAIQNGKQSSTEVQDESQLPSKEGYERSWEELAAKLESDSLIANRQTNQYVFRENNPHTNETEDIDSLFEKAVEMYKQGKISDAIYAFEGILQNEQGKEHDESWRMLGLCHAENDEDKKAITCLNMAIECDPYNLEALLALGTSYVNELNSVKALETLRQWVEHHPKFQGIEIQQDEYSDGTLMDEVMQLMLQVEHFAPNDVDVLIVLGVLYNVSLDYDTAIDCFQKARNVSMEAGGDYSILNKLAATYANNNLSEQAIPNYLTVLKLRPTYARGWLNLGISYANLNKYEDAAKSYVQALHLNPNAKHIWSYLRIVFSCMEKFDLVKLSSQEDTKLLAQNLNMELINPF